MTDSELLELWNVIRKTKGILDSLFRPDHYNYSFLMNLDSPVHLHVIPRYETAREFEGADFYGSDGMAENRLSHAAHDRLVQSLRKASSIIA